MSKKTRMFVRQLKSIGFVDRGACEGADIILAKRDDSDSTNKGEDSMSKPSELEIAKARIEELEAELEAAKSAQPAEPVDVMKGLPEEVRKRFEQLEAQNAATEAALKAERDSRQLESFVAKAQAFSALSIEAGKFGPVLKRIADAVADEDLIELERVLKSANEAVSASEVFKQRGHGGDDSTALDRINAKASDLVEKGNAKTHAEAIAKVAETDPRLYAAYRAELGARS